MTRTLVRLLAFTAVCLGFTAWLGFTIGNVSPFEDRYTLTAAYEDATGLLPNDNVKVAGVVVGKVNSVKVEEGYAVVEFSVNDDVELSTDTETAIRWRNLLGQRYVYLYPGDGGDLLEAGDRIPAEQTRPIVDIGELFNRLGPIINALDPEEVNEFLVAVTEALGDGNDVALGDALADFGLAIDTLATRDEAIGRLVENLADLTGAIASRDRQLRTILDNTTDLAATFNEHTDVVESTIDDLGSFSEILSRIIAENRPGIDRIIPGVAELAGVVEQRLDTLDRTVAGLDEFTLALYDSSRYGEWLNQWITCLVVDFDGPGGVPEEGDDDLCTGRSGNASQSAAAAKAPNPVGDVLGEVLSPNGSSGRGAQR